MTKYIRLLLAFQLLWSWTLIGDAFGESQVGVTVSPSPDTPNREIYSSLEEAVHAAPEDAMVLLSAGTFVVSNPIVLKKRGVKISGKGRNRTLIVPENPGLPVFEVRANDVTVESMKVEGQTPDGTGRASVGFNIAENIQGFSLYHSFIVNIGASSVLGHSVDNLLLHGNIIASSGDDGVQLSGRNIIISNNIILGYFDEAIDILQSRHLIIKDNYLALGRIGLTADRSSNFVIDHNLIVNHTMQGMVLVSKGNGNVSGNVVVDAEETGIVLESIDLVMSNLVKGKAKLGFQLRDITGGVIVYNQALGAIDGFDVPGLRLSLVSGNLFSDKNGKYQYIGMPNTGAAPIPIVFRGQLCEEKEFLALSTFLANGSEESNLVSGDSDCISAVVAENIKQAFADRGGKVMKAMGVTSKDQRTGDKISAFFQRHNPGFLTLEVNGPNIKSQITEDLYHTLLGIGQKGIGLVRYPYIMLTWDFDSSVEWDLYYQNSRVATVEQGDQSYEVNITLHAEHESLKGEKLLSYSESRLAS